VKDASLDYVTTPNSYPFNQKEVLGAQEEEQTRFFPRSTGQFRNAWVLNNDMSCCETVPSFNPLYPPKSTFLVVETIINWVPN
jgi:hypothetical protein